jgi:hypothetical protein
MAAMFMLVHFEMDLTYLVGNIQHHADISRFTDKSNASTVDTLPQGFLLTYFFNIAWLFVCFKYLFHYSRRLQHYSNASLISALFLFSGQVSLKMLKEDHPKFHAVAQENWRDAIPFSFECVCDAQPDIAGRGGGSGGLLPPTIPPLARFRRSRAGLRLLRCPILC